MTKGSRSLFLTITFALISTAGLGAVLNASDSPLLTQVKAFLRLEASQPPQRTTAPKIGQSDLVSSAYQPLSPPLGPAVSTSIVISQVYGGAGCGTAGCSAYKNDYIELFNRGAIAQSLNGWSVQYSSAAGTTWQVTNLTNVTIQPGQYYLVGEGAGANGVNNIPTPDATGTIAMSASAAKVAVVNSTTALSGACGNGSLVPASVVDLIGYAATATCSETSTATAPSDNFTAMFRAGSGCTDTDHNSTDFATATAGPRNTASALHSCVSATPTTTSLSSSANPQGTGQNVTFTATVTQQPSGVVGTGTVSFYDNNACSGTQIGSDTAVNGSGQAQVTTNSLTAGDHNIKACYNGNSSFAASSGSLVQHIVTPTITLGQSSFDFGNQDVGTTSTSQSSSVSGSNLTGDITCSLVAGGSQYVLPGQTVFTQGGGTASGNLDVAFKPTATGSQPGTLRCSSPGAASQDITLSGTGTTPAPTVTSISPTTGPAAGNTSVTITGTNFLAGSTVSFGGTAGTAVVVNSATSISVNSPAHAAGTVDVTVTTSGGTSSISGNDQFTYADPSVTLGAGSLANFNSVNPGNFSVEKSTSITGSNLTGNIVCTAPADFAVSTTNTVASFGSTATFTQSGGSVSGTLHVRFQPQSVGAKNESVSCTTTGLASPQTLSVTGTALGLTEVYLPQVIQGGEPNLNNNKRVPYPYAVTLSGLTANATYRYNIYAVLSTTGAESNGQGDALFTNTSGAFTEVSGQSLSIAGDFGSFTTDASGNYTGWFAIVPNGNAATFGQGTPIYFRLLLNDGGSGTTAKAFLTTTNSATGTQLNTSGANTGTAIYGNSFATGKNFVLLYDNTAGTGRPYAGAIAEDDGLAAAASWAQFYKTNVDGSNGNWGAIIPNALPNGIRRIEQRSINGASLVWANTDADGAWPSGANTVDPIGGDTTPIHITNTDAPLVEEFAVNYQGNGSTGGTAPSDPNQYPSGATVTVLGPGTLVKAGSAFSNWNTQADGSGAAYNPSDTFAISGNTTLYAQWSQLPPSVTTNAASSVTFNSATLNGSANPNGVATTGYFRYDTTDPGTCNDTFGTRAPLAGGTSLGSGTSSAPFTQGLTGLTPLTTYYYCAIATNSGGTAFGSVQSFQTNPALPATPAITASNPTSPSKTSTTPTFSGTSSVGSTTIDLYTVSNCSLGGSPIATGDGSTGTWSIANVPVGDNTTTTVFASATNVSGTSGCSTGFQYTHDNTAPLAPSISGSNPATPDPSTSPHILGTAEANSTVTIHLGSDCTGAVKGTGTATGGNFDIPISGLIANTPNVLSANATDLAGNTGVCSSPFTYNAYAAPTVTGISPTSGPAAGGTAVSITGTNFSLSPNTIVTFGGTASSTVAVSDSQHLTATSPAGSGTVDVTVTTPGGTSGASGADEFTYVAATADYTITTSGNAIVVTDVAGNDDDVSMFETAPNSGQLNFTAPGRYFSVNGAPATLGNSGDVALAGATSITVDLGAGNDSFVASQITSTLPQMTVNGGTGNDNIQFSSPITFAADASLDLDLQNDDATPGTDVVNIVNPAAPPAAVLTFSGVGGATIKASGSIQITGGGITTENGNIDIEANQQAASNALNITGVTIDSSTIQTTGTGTITIKGKGSDGGATDVANAMGILVQNNALISAAQGTVTIDGTGGNGNLTTPGASGSNDLGVYVTLGGVIRTDGGDMTVTGHGGTTNDTAAFGIALDANGTIETIGSGKLTINGTGGDVQGGNASFVDSSGVDITTDGANGGIVRSTSTAANAGSITITATALNGGAGSAQGFRLDAPGTVSTANGDISITGSTGACGNQCLGVSIRGSVTATGTAAITIDGTGAASSGVFPTHGANVRTGGLVETNTGNITITGTGGNGGDNAGINIASSGTGTVRTTSTGTISLIADHVVIRTTASALVTANSAGGNSGTVTIAPKSNSIGVDLGSTTDASATSLELSDAELDRVLAGTLNIGKTTTGAISVTSNISRAASTDVGLLSVGDITILSGSIDTAGGNITSTPGGLLTTPHAGVDFSTGAGVTKIASGKTLSIAINGTTVDTDYDQLSASGSGVDVSGAVLAFTGSYAPQVGDSFTIANNDSANAVTGTFSGLPEGGILSDFRGSGHDASITYKGGDGNDIVVTVMADTADLVTAMSDSQDPVTVGNNVTYTIGVTNNGPHVATGIAVTDTLPASMQFISATTSQGSLVTPPVGSTGTVTANLGTIAVSGSATVTITVKTTATGTITNSATANGNETDPHPATNTASEQTVVQNAADTTPPTTSIDSGPSDPTNVTTATFTYHAADDSAVTVTKFSCQIDSNSPVSCDSPVNGQGSYTTPTLLAGPHTFKVFGTDGSNNTDPAGASFTWTIDTTAPTVAYEPRGATLSNTNVPLNVTVTDDLAVASVSVFYAINGGPFTSSSCPLDTGSSYACTIPGNGNGTAVSYYVTATDTATNETDVPDASAPDLYTVGAANVPAGQYSTLSAGAGSTLVGDVTVDNNLDLQGIIDTGTFTLTLACGATVTNAGPSAYVIGNLQKAFCGAENFTFPVGTTPDGSSPTHAPNIPGPPPEFSPFVAHVTSAAPGSSLTVTVVDGVLTGSDATASASRYWDVTQVGAITADISFTYLDQDVNGNESNYKVLKRESGATNVVAGGTVDAPTNTASVNGVSSFSQWAAGVKLGPTAAEVSLGGRVVTPDGRGIANVMLAVSGDALSRPLMVRTNAFGYYVIDGVPSGHSYLLTASAEHFTFAQPYRLVTPTDSISDLNFTAEPR